MEDLGFQAFVIETLKLPMHLEALGNDNTLTSLGPSDYGLRKFLEEEVAAQSMDIFKALSRCTLLNRLPEGQLHLWYETECLLCTLTD